MVDNNEKQKHRLERLIKIAGDQRFKIWEHFEKRAEEVRSRLWTIGTWLLGLLAGLLALVHQSGAVKFGAGFPGVTIVQPWPALIASIIGLSFLAVLFFAFLDHVHHVERNWLDGSTVRDNTEDDGKVKIPEIGQKGQERFAVYLRRSWSVILYAGILFAIPYVFLLYLSVRALDEASPRVAVGPTGGQTERRVTILAVNDIYRIGGIERGQRGGLPRLRTLRRELERDDPDLIMLHAGDAIFPSMLSNEYKGRQMIAVMNMLDGSEDYFDNRLFVVFGNHEFDKGKLHDAWMLSDRVRESHFTWLRSNITFRTDRRGTPLVAGDNLVESRIVEANGVKVGLFGLTIDIAKPEYVLSFREPVEEARRLSGDLRRQGAEAVVAVTHLTLDQDKKILDILGDEGPDVIIGGHEHKRQSYKRDSRHQVIKADADAVSAAIVRITLKWDPDRLKWVPQAISEPKYRDLGGDRPPPDEEVNRAVQEWNDRFDMEFCLPLGDPVNCLDEEIGRTEVTLEAEEEQIRSCETNFGNWIADQALDAFRDWGAQGAIINAGSLRLNQNIPQGPILRRDLEELIQYPNSLRLIQVKRTILRDIATNAINGWPGNGRWLQVSGLSFHDVDPRNPFGSRLELTDQNGSEDVRIVVTDFLLDKERGQDGYTKLEATQVVADSPKVKLKDILREALKRTKEPDSKGINPGRTGRIRFVPGVETPCEG